MNFTRLALQHTISILKAHWLLFVLLATAHLVTNAVFTGFVSFAFNTLFYSSRIQPEAVGLIASAPLVASLTVIITSVTFGTARWARVINRRFLGDWIPVTLIFAWFFAVAWFCRVHLPGRIEAYVGKNLWVTGYVSAGEIAIYLPWLIMLIAATVATLSVPIFVARRQVFWRNYAMLPPLLVLLSCAVLMSVREAYRELAGTIDPYYWLPFPGYHPEAVAYDQMLYALLELPFLIPVSIVMTCFAASLLVAVDRDRGIDRSPVET